MQSVLFNSASVVTMLSIEQYSDTTPMVSFRSLQHWMCLACSPAHPKIPQKAATKVIIWGRHYNIYLPMPPHTPRQTGKRKTWTPQASDSQV